MTEPPRSTGVVWQRGIEREQRWAALGHGGATVWMTGLPASGKSTVAAGVEARLLERGRGAYVLDGDNLRHGLNGDLGFSAEDRAENVRRTAEVSALLADAGVVVLVALVSPYRADRAAARAAHDRRGPAVPRGVGRDVAGGVRAARPEGALRPRPRGRADGHDRASTTRTSRPKLPMSSCGATSRWTRRSRGCWPRCRAEGSELRLGGEAGFRPPGLPIVTFVGLRSTKASTTREPRSRLPTSPKFVPPRRAPRPSPAAGEIRTEKWTARLRTRRRVSLTDSVGPGSGADG